MPKRVKQRTSDINEIAHQLVERATKEPEERIAGAADAVSRYMSEIGRKGGRIGGKRRLETLTANQRHKIASKAARTRWKKTKGSL
jgi:cell division protein ZapA (FtsZ GTPase activity inhibitor)